MRERLDQNPLRAFDADHEGTRAVMTEAPRLLDRLTAEDAEHFAAVRALLDDAGLEYELDSTLVRGLDYTRTVFELESPRWARRRHWAAAGATIGWSRSGEGHPPRGGLGRRDRAASSSPARCRTPRSACSSRWPSRIPPRRPSLWRAGCVMRASGWSWSRRVPAEGPLKQADRIGARTTVILGDTIDVKDMDSGRAASGGGPDEAVQMVQEALR